MRFLHFAEATPAVSLAFHQGMRRKTITEDWATAPVDHTETRHGVTTQGGLPTCFNSSIYPKPEVNFAAPEKTE